MKKFINLKKNKTTVFLLVLCTLSFAAHLCLLPLMPDTVPTHWSFDGTVDGYSSKYTTIFLSALPLLMLILFFFIPKIDPRGKNYQKHEKAYQVFQVLIILFCLVMNWSTNAVIFGYPLRIELIAPLGLGALFLAAGNYMPQIRPNYTFGIRTPWTLESEWVWKKTHTMGGIVFCISGVIFLISAFFPEKLSFVALGVLLAGLFWLYFYSWLMFKKERNGQNKE